MKEFLDFLGGQAPYDVLDADDLDRLAAAIEVEYFPTGTIIIADGQERVENLWVVRSGSIELVDRGRVVDSLGPGDTFGHVSLLSGQPATLSVRAAEDSLCYRLPDPRTVVQHADRLRFDFYGSAVVRDRLTNKAGGLGERAHAPVTKFVRPVVQCAPDDSIREVASRISDANQSCAVVVSERDLGIVTDHDYRKRVGSGSIGVDAPVRTISSHPVLTVTPDTSVATALLTMIEYGVHHLVVVDPGGRPIGVLRVVDLASSELRDPLVIRAAVEEAGSVDDLAEACHLLPSTSVELFDTGVPAERIGAVLAVVIDAVLRRLIEFADNGTDLDRIRRSWLLLGSLARRDPLPTSDIDTALVWQADGDLDIDNPGERMRAAASRVLDRMEECGLPRCADGANADTPRFNRSLAEWVNAAGTWIKELSGDGALLLATMLADSRPINEVALGRSAAERMLRAVDTPQFRRALLDYTLSSRPPTGFVRGFVVEHSGEHRGQLSLKRGGLRPITSLGRWVAVVTADPHGTTTERLRRGAEEGMFTTDESESLISAYGHLYGLLMEQEVEALRIGQTPSTYVSPASLDSLTRRHLRESFRAIAHVQDKLGSQWQARWG